MAERPWAACGMFRSLCVMVRKGNDPRKALGHTSKLSATPCAQ